MWITCGASLSPWGTHLSSEEYEPDAPFVSSNAQADNLKFSEKLRTLFIGEDSGQHINNFLWAYNVDTKVLSRVMSVGAVRRRIDRPACRLDAALKPAAGAPARACTIGGMAIQWFPGHMNATKKAISERVRAGIDVVIELLDARLPGSSGNPLLAELTVGKPALKILNKQDLADPERTVQWLAHFNALPGTRALALDASETAPTQRLVEASRALAPLRGGMTKPMRVLICGIPNVGKSTLVNTLAGRRIAKTGDEAGITKLEQKIALANDFDLFDTPGMMWPRITVPESGYLLAASGAIGRNAFDEEEVALELIGRLRSAVPGRLDERYKLVDSSALTDDELLAQIAGKRAAALAHGRVNLQKAAEIVMHEFRQGLLGRMTLETPEEFAAWSAAGAVIEAERQARRKKPAREAG